MKKCPYCAEEIQDQAVKCKHCGEWLKDGELVQTEKSSSDSIIASPQVKQLPLTKPLTYSLNLKDISLSKLLQYLIIIPASVLLLDGCAMYTFPELFKRITASEINIIFNTVFFLWGLGIANYIYKLKKVKIIIGFSFAILFLFRFLILLILDSSLIEDSLFSSLGEGLVIWISIIIFTFLFRYFESKFDYSEIRDVFESEDPVTKKKFDSGTCSKCQGITVTGKERFISFLGKGSEYFCQNCNRFIEGNPINSIFLGIGEAILSLLFMLGVAASMHGKSSSGGSIFSIFFLVGIYDGIKRLSFGISGVRRSIKKT